MQQDPSPGSGAYDFLNQQPVQQGRKLPLPKLPKTAWIILICSLGILGILVAVALLFGGRSGSSNVYTETLAYAQEINRVSGQVKELSQDPTTQGLAATAAAVTLSHSTQLNGYFKDSDIKIDSESLSSKQDKDIDSQLQSAAQTGRLAETYADYLNSYLIDYQTSLQAAYEQVGPEGKAILNEAYESIEMILSSSALKASS